MTEFFNFSFSIPFVYTLKIFKKKASKHIPENKILKLIDILNTCIKSLQSRS